eukprot:185948-Chlamydomonas_euryale.AAC.1
MLHWDTSSRDIEHPRREKRYSAVWGVGVLGVAVGVGEVGTGHLRGIWGSSERHGAFCGRWGSLGANKAALGQLGNRKGGLRADKACLREQQRAYPSAMSHLAGMSLERCHAIEQPEAAPRI